MFYSNALSVRLKLLKIKKETRTIRRLRGKKRVPGGYEGAGKKGPNQFEGGGEKERVAGGGKSTKNNQFEGAMKKRVPKGGV